MYETIEQKEKRLEILVKHIKDCQKERLALDSHIRTMKKRKQKKVYNKFAIQE